MRRDGFYLKDLPPDADPDKHMITITWYEKGERKTVRKAFRNRRSTVMFLKELEGPIAELQGGLFHRGILEDRILQQAFLEGRLTALEREVRYFLQNQGNSTLFKKTYTKEELAPLQAFYDGLKTALRKTARARSIGSGTGDFFDPSNPEHGYDISDWALRKVELMQIRSEFTQFFLGGNLLGLAEKFVGRALSWAGRKIGWKPLEVFGG